MNLTSVTIPDTVTEIEEYAFQCCFRLKEVKFGIAVTKIGLYAFNLCLSLTNITLPDSVKEIGDRAFYNCASLSNVKLSKGLKTLGGGAFADTAIRTVEIPKSLADCGTYGYYNYEYEDENYSINSGPFNTLTSVTFENGITRIADDLFTGCVNLTSVTIPDTVTEIEEYAFSNCFCLKNLALGYNIDNIKNNAFYNCKRLEVYCPLNSKASIRLIDQNVPFKSTDDYYKMETVYLLNSKSGFSNSFSSVANGGTIQLICEYEINDSTYNSLKNQKIRIKIPKGSYVVPKSLMVNGTLYTLFDDNDENYLVIPISMKKGRVSFSLKLTEDTDLISYATLEYSTNQKNDYEIIGVINENVPSISIETVQITSNPSIEVSGIAKADSSIKLYIDEQFICLVNTNKVGYYSTSLELPNPKDGKNYILKAVSEDEDDKKVFAKTSVHYSSESPMLTSFTMQYGGNEYDLLSEQRPTVVYNSSFDLSFRLNFSHPENIKKVYVYSERHNITKRIEAFWNQNLKSFVAEGKFDENNPNYVPGRLYVEYAEEYGGTAFQTYLDPEYDGFKQLAEEAEVTVIENSDSSTKLDVTLDGQKMGFEIKTYSSIDEALEAFEIPPYQSSMKKAPAQKALSEKSDDDKILKYLFDQFIDKYQKKTKKNIEAKIEENGVLMIQDGEDIEYIICNGAKDTVVQFSAQTVFTAILSGKFNSYVDDVSFETFKSNWGTAGSFVSFFSTAKDMIDGAINFKGAQQKIRESTTMTSEEKEYAQKELERIGFLYGGFCALELGMCFAKPYITAAATATLGPVGGLLVGLAITGAESLIKNYLEGAIDYYSSGGRGSYINWCIDPSGYVFDKETNERLSGVTATCYWIPFDEENSEEYWTKIPDSTSYGEIWDAKLYSQFNPLITDSQGQYAWDVPEGWWRVKFEKDGYEATWSDWVSVPPPQTEVNVGLISKGKCSDGHKLTKTAAKAATCTAAGNVEYYTCSVCKKTFSDAKGTKAITNVTVKATGHKLSKTAAKAATCTTAGNVEYYTCSVCKKTFSDAKGTKAITDVTVKAAGHKLTKTAAKAATCTVAGNVEYYTCSVCKKTFSDAKGTKAITDVTVKATGHKLTKTAAKAATCTAAGNVEYYTCSVCKKTFSDAKGTMAITNVTVKAAGHKLTKTAAKAATCTTAGNVEYYTCSVCKKTFSDAKGTKVITDVTVKATGHKLTKTAAKAATCTTAGNVEYYACSVCKKTFSDAKGTKAITDVTVKATGHSFGAWTVTTPATAAAEGVETRVCAKCGAKETRKVEKLKYVPGDVNGDGDIGADDARLALRRSVDLEDYPEGSAAFLVCDVNRDKTVGADDARLILRASVDLEDLSKIA